MTDVLVEALRLVVSGDPDVFRAVGLSIATSGAATVIAGLVGIPLGASLAVRNAGGGSGWTRAAVSLLGALMGLPPVVAGLVVFLLLSQAGPFGRWHLLFTPAAVVIAQVVLVTPIVAALTHAAVAARVDELRVALLGLGASSSQLRTILVREARPGIVAAVLAGLGRAVAEVGAVMMVGGNIAGYTRVTTAAIVLETRQGNFERALALGLILMTVYLGLVGAVRRLEQGVRGR